MKRRATPRGGLPRAPIMGRQAWVRVLLLGAAMSIAGCTEEEAEEGAQTEDLTIVVEADKSRILQEEELLSKQREAVESEQDRLKRERLEVEEKLATLSKKDRKTREKLEAEQDRLAKEEGALRDRINKFESERAKLEKEKSQLLDRISSLTATKGGLTIEQRESRIAQREKTVAAREEQVAKREAALAAREKDAAHTLQELNGILASLKDGGVTRTVIVNSGSPSGTTTAAAPSSANRSQAVKAQKGVKAKMDAKGILMDDLPPTAKARYDDGNKALDNKEYGEAVSAFSEVEQHVDGILVNHGFLNGKMKRINREVGKLDEDTKKKVMPLLLEMGDAFSNGRYDRANKKANQIVSVLRTN